jgi:hypothetical protein
MDQTEDFPSWTGGVARSAGVVVQDPKKFFTAHFGLNFKW